MKTTSERYIDASEEVMAKLAKVFGCTEKYVYMALTYRKDNATAKKIRFTAVHNYGAKPYKHCPECETLHNLTADGRKVMEQRFDNGAVLTVDKESGALTVRDRRGNVKGEAVVSGISTLAEMQMMAEAL